MNEVERLKNQLLEPRGMEEPPVKLWLPTGSTLLNLACAGRADRGLPVGRYHWLVGDSDSGKTWLTLSMLAEASRLPAFDEHRFIHDDAEGGSLMNIRRYFGSKVVERIEPPRWDDGQPVYSTEVEDFHFYVSDAFDQSRPFIYILDSMDVLEAKADAKKFEKRREAHRKGTKEAGSYGMDKAKENSASIRRMMSRLRTHDTSIVIIISQTREGEYGKTASGGRALPFYATCNIWTKCGNRLTRELDGVKYQTGVECIAQIHRNRVTGKKPTVSFPIYHSYGIDDVGSCIDYLLSVKHWKMRKQTIIAPELEIEASRPKMIREVERQGLEEVLSDVVGDVWNQIEKACELDRKARYA